MPPLRPPRPSATTSRFFAAPSPASSSPATRRITRSSIRSRLKDEEDMDVKQESPWPRRIKDEPTSSPPPIADIEDIVCPAPGPSRKRKRTAPAPTASSRKIKKEEEDSDEDVKPSDLLAAASTRPIKRSPSESKPSRKPRGTPQSQSAAIPVPANYHRIWPLLEKMRAPGGSAYPAAVDTMGCAQLASPLSSPRDRRFQTLVALMLSSQTKDEITAAAIASLQGNLKPHVPGAVPGLTLENVLAATREELHSCIAKVGFHNAKTDYIFKSAAILRDKFNSDIPDTIAGLVSLPGVGPKMAHLTMSAQNGWGRVEGIGVDVHVHRIANLWGWTGKKGTKTPEETRAVLEGWLDKDKWGPINGLLVGFGQAVCKSVGKRCGECEIGLEGGLCRGADRGKVNEGRRKRGLGVKKKEDGEEEDVLKVVKVEKMETDAEEEDDPSRLKMEHAKRIKIEAVEEDVTDAEEEDDPSTLKTEYAQSVKIEAVEEDVKVHAKSRKRRSGVPLAEKPEQAEAVKMEMETEEEDLPRSAKMEDAEAVKIEAVEQDVKVHAKTRQRRSRVQVDAAESAKIELPEDEPAPAIKDEHRDADDTDQALAEDKMDESWEELPKMESIEFDEKTVKEEYLLAVDKTEGGQQAVKRERSTKIKRVSVKAEDPDLKPGVLRDVLGNGAAAVWTIAPEDDPEKPVLKRRKREAVR